MIANKWIIKFLSFLLPVLFYMCGNEADPVKGSIIGKWQSVNRQHDMGTTIIFTSDSSVSMASDVFVNYDYKLDGDQLISISKDMHTGKNVIDTSTVEFKDNTIIMKRVQQGIERTTILTREESKTGKNKISGKWTWIHQSGKLAHSEFFDNGKATAYILIKARKGTFTTLGDTLSMSFPEANMQDIIYRINNDTLYFDSYDGKAEHAYKRFK